VVDRPLANVTPVTNGVGDLAALSLAEPRLAFVGKAWPNRRFA
jgi:hypothetical protein